ncbi:hypothetical protein PoB_007238500 [Plakobranchus ocellatus]|uniref:Uncharacterized protein n=1 Tax=Plakobranchus ocellatus TaxID=259542 RepID=A0AAV4DP12_9GAST|nr:hypothetical protein PoB_007238500 [Plakobranchus ocellatus]
MLIAFYIIRNVCGLVEKYLDPAVKGSNLTKTLMARYGAIVPDKDYIPLEIDFGPWLLWIPSKVFDIGLLVVAFSAFGIYVVAAGKKLHLYILISFLVAADIGQILFMISLLDINSRLHTSMRRSLLATMHSRYEFGAEIQDIFSLILNSIMVMVSIAMQRCLIIHRYFP